MTYTKTEIKVLEFIKKYKREKQISPTLREIGEALGWSEKGGFANASKEIAKLIKKEVLDRQFASARSLVLTKKGEKLLKSIDNHTN